jgi:hypothetical protein
MDECWPKLGMDESKRWKAYKVVMFFEKAKPSTKGVRAFVAWTYSLGLDFNEKNWAPNGKRGMKAPREGHHLNKGGPKVK